MKKKPVLIVWERFGPYHHTRADAARRIMPIATLEMSPVDKTYAWDRVNHSRPDHYTAYNGDLDNLTATQLRSLLWTKLDQISPTAIAIPGWSERWALILLDWALSHEVPAILMSASNEIDEVRHPGREWIKRRVVSCFSAGLVGGTWGTDYLVRLGLNRDKVFSGYDVVDNDHFRARQNAAVPAAIRDMTNGRPFFLNTARFIAKKNLHGLIDAYATYRENSTSEAWSLVILGDGSLRTELEKQRDALGLNDAIFFPGFKQYDELPDWYAAAKAFVLPSTTEQWGLVVNEAMAAGLPVLVSNRCGCALDLVRDGENGWVFDPNSKAAIANAMLKISGDGLDIKTMGENSLKTISNWSPDRYAQGLKSAFIAAQNEQRKDTTFLDRIMFRALSYR